ncbi:MAG TPA: hypothetical protein PK200_16845 [Spirochaetota bacterium]|nr:hypothetical protein [Spirochaetota bacterium]
MKRNEIFTFTGVIALLFITMEYNRILFLNLKMFNLLNIILYGITVLLFIHIAKESAETVTLYSWISVFLLFMAGINIRYKIKFFVFLTILLAIQCVVTIARDKTTGGHISMRRILLFAAGVCISMVPLVLLYSRISSPLYYILAAISLGGIEAVLLMTAPAKKSISESKGPKS